MGEINNPWIVNIFGGIISTVVGGLILAAVQGTKSAGAYQSATVEYWLGQALRLVVYFVAMTFVTGVVVLMYGDPSFRMIPFGGIIVFGVWLTAAIWIFGAIFFGWRLETR